MCGIFAVVGEKNNDAAKTILIGLKRLLYRGYDSWGIAVESANKISLVKDIGEINQESNIKNLPRSKVGIGHTRWATTGVVTRVNAHPHYATDKSFVLAQNGIVENYKELKRILIREKYLFQTSTDTEVIVRLIETELKKTNDLLIAIRRSFLKLKGRNTIIVLTEKGEIFAARNGSPLVVGLNKKTKEFYISSDVLSFAPFVSKMIVVDNGKLVSCFNNNIDLFDIKSGKKENIQIESIAIKSNDVDKEGYPHFMIKEINEAPDVLLELIKQDDKLYQQFVKKIRKARNVFVIGSGTAGAAAAQIAFYFRNYSKINAIGLVGSEAREYIDIINKNDLFMAVSQSGETADVLEILEFVKEKGATIASFVNMPGSMITRMSDYKFMAQAGPEICVLSTKIFVSQIAWGYLLAKGVIGQLKDGKENLKKLAKEIKTLLNNDYHVRQLAQILLSSRDIFLLGKYQNLQIAKEGMVKLIEGTYKHAHAIPAGDLKHYAMTIMEKGIPVIALLSNDIVKEDLLMAVDEVKARGATVIGISPKKYDQFDFFIPMPDIKEVSAILNIIPLQLLAYFMSVKLRHNVDKPRNIAKSVTVK